MHPVSLMKTFNYSSSKKILASACVPCLAIGFSVLLGFATLQAGDKQKDSSTGTTDVSNLVWPQPPQRKRLQFLKQIGGVDDVKGKQKRGWMDRAAGAKAKSPRTKLRTPYGIAADSQGRIYVADAANRAVFVFDLEGKQVEYRGTHAPAQMATPVGVAIDKQDRLFVSDSFFHQITAFDPEGKVLGVFGSKELQRPGGIAVDSARKLLYVTDAKTHRVAIFETDHFTFVRYFGKPSTEGEAEEGTFASPTNVAVDAAGSVYVTDGWNCRVQVFDASGKFLRAFGQHGVSPGSFTRPKGIAVDADGHVYVADAEFNNIQVLTKEGQPLLALGSYGSDPGQFILVAGVAIDGNSRVYVTDQWRGRIQIFQYFPDEASAAPKVAAQ